MAKKISIYFSEVEDPHKKNPTLPKYWIFWVVQKCAKKRIPAGYSE
jgi:hypothetical protein